MAHQSRAVPALRLTYITHKGARSTRIFHSSRVAAEYYAMMSSHDWWCEKGHLDPDLVRRKERLQQREARTLRRVLPIFQRVLP